MEFELDHAKDILRRTPEMPALAPIVAFEHHLRQDLIPVVALGRLAPRFFPLALFQRRPRDVEPF